MTTTVLLMAIGAGVLSALPLMIAVAEPSGLLLVLLSPLPLFLAGLSQGVAAALIAGATTVAAIGILAGFVAAIGTVVILGAPVTLLVRLALLSRPLAGAGNGAAVEWYPPGLLVGWLSGIGMVWLGLAALVLSGQGEGIAAGAHADVLESLRLMVPQATDQELAQVASLVAPFAVGAGLASWLLLLAVNGALAQGVLGRFGRNRRPAPDIAAIELPRWIAWALAAALLASFVAPGDFGFLAQNLAIMLLLPFFFVGLAVVHSVTRRFKSRTAVLVAFYGVLVLFTWPAALVAGLGLIEQWAQIRRRSAAGGNAEDE